MSRIRRPPRARIRELTRELPIYVPVRFQVGGRAEFPGARDYAYCALGPPHLVVVAPDFADLEPASREAILRHELAHALEWEVGANQVEALEDLLGVRLSQGAERRADQMAEAIWGDPIRYRSRDLVQTIRRRDSVAPRPRHLPEDFGE